MNYYFTFGQNHWNKEGYPMKNSWVRVVAGNYEEARTKFVNQFSSIEMEKPDKWEFQYEEKEFSPHFFPNGEFCCIN